MITIIPAILETTEELYAQTLSRLDESGLFTEGTVQVDFADGNFVSNTTIGVDSTAKYKTSMQKEAHLMVNDPSDWLEELAAQGFSRVIWHIEVGETATVLDLARNLKMEVGLALNPETPVSQMEAFLDKVDVVQVMSIQPGWQGQQFMPNSLEKMKQLVEIRQQKKLKFDISVDGGIKPTNIKQIIEAGAERLVVGSALLEGSLDENLEALWEAIK